MADSQLRQFIERKLQRSDTLANADAAKATFRPLLRDTTLQLSSHAGGIPSLQARHPQPNTTDQIRSNWRCKLYCRLFVVADVRLQYSSSWR